ncbi:MAG: hypothetical protein AAGC55_04495, partial [Myxococcota bacterium]
RLAPNDPRIKAAVNSGRVSKTDNFADRARVLRQMWRRDPSSPEPGLELVRIALDAGYPDAAFMAASALVTRGMANQQAEDLYKRHRPRFVIRAQRTLDGQRWAALRHPLDSPELCAVFEILAPAIEASFPLSLEDLELDESMEVTNEELPEPFIRMRAYVAQMLGVQSPRVFVRSDFGHQIHVGAVSPPLLLAGDDILTSPERAELSFRIGRAMTYLMPGRTFAGSRPARLLKAAVLAVYQTLQPNIPLEDPQGLIATVTPHLAAMPPNVLGRAQTLVAQLTEHSGNLNLSKWSRALARTADRVGLMMCGDLPAAVRFVRDSGSIEAVDALIDFAIGNNCWHVRDALGISIAV